MSGQQHGPLAYLLAALAVGASVAMVLLAISAGWWAMWYTVLHRIKFFREVLGLDREQQSRNKAAAQKEIEGIRRKLHAR
eukprot:CAMPEP_0202868164 /NCGR_PEP_ID=MMETSP1391-20130828/10327_1 /ASSEMBLY_ACC=CAM_ASM_000867 /TAXON_ID=1034604 /ORGANISM="Chlamydomonas leiostraca, Strain SAG 11-49" /LENGTH=79 /DNA_ID=CAMNT_0049548285 /DNA_START=97 /DNA_END=336 /DNA_ORIENTATION=+